MDPSLQPLLTRLERLSDEFREIREGIEKAVLVAKVDPEMALTRARKVLELVVREIFQRRVNEPPGTRPLENLIQRLVKDGYFPDRLDAYASTIRKLGNVDTHSFGEGVTRTDVRLSLSQLMPILDWYFQVERPDAVVTKPPAPAAPPEKPPPPSVRANPTVLDRPDRSQSPDKRPPLSVRATPSAMPKKPSGRPQAAPAPLPVIPETMRKGRIPVARAMKTADAKPSRKWLLGPLAIVLLLAGLLGLILAFAPKNHFPSADSQSTKTPSGGRSSPEWGKSITNSIGMKLVRVEPGVFLMGSPESENERFDDEHQHEVEITRPFHVGVYEVTQEQYERVMGKNPNYFSSTGAGKDTVNGMDTRQFPVDEVAWKDAVEFCRQLSKLPEEKANERLYRLPTEAEWEYISRDGPFFKKPSPPFSFGNSLSASQANFDGNFPYGGTAKGVYLERPTKVGSYPPNPLGLYDLHGNVWEWCADWCDKDYYKNSPRQDPQGPENGERRVLRGGSWVSYGRLCRAAYRNGNAPGDRVNYYGFRVVLVAGART